MGEAMTGNLQSGRAFEEAVEAFFKFMGYKTQTNIVLQTRPVRIHAEMQHPLGTQKVLIECKHHAEEPVDIKEVEKFCHTVALAREKSLADRGLLISNADFSEEAQLWCAKNCSFVELKTYKQLICKSIRFNKLLRKFRTAF
jgi:restriction endonuclease Mrr